jgi:heme-degrading monooxygenase HmoA
MFCIVYEFTVKESQNQVFEKAWADFTEAIFRARGSLGSRLHRTHNPQLYIAYAQWPSEELFNDSPGDGVFTDVELRARDAMRASLTETKVVYRLNVSDDHLRPLE